MWRGRRPGAPGCGGAGGREQQGLEDREQQGVEGPENQEQQGLEGPEDREQQGVEGPEVMDNVIGAAGREQVVKGAGRGHG